MHFTVFCGLFNRFQQFTGFIFTKQIITIRGTGGGAVRRNITLRHYLDFRGSRVGRFSGFLFLRLDVWACHFIKHIRQLGLSPSVKLFSLLINIWFIHSRTKFTYIRFPCIRQWLLALKVHTVFALSPQCWTSTTKRTKKGKWKFPQQIVHLHRVDTTDLLLPQVRLSLHHCKKNLLFKTLKTKPCACAELINHHAHAWNRQAQSYGATTQCITCWTRISAMFISNSRCPYFIGLFFYIPFICIWYTECADVIGSCNMVIL